MFKCKSCDNIFSLPAKFQLENGERFHGCPECGEKYIAARRCLGCNSYFETGELTENYCEDCKTEIVRKFNNIIYCEFTPCEVELLNNVYDGLRF